MPRRRKTTLPLHLSPALRAALLAAASLLGACGGDTAIAPSAATVSAPATSPVLDTAPTATLALAAAKTLHFAWNDVAGETEYRLLEDPDGSSGYSLVATLPPDSTQYDHEVFLPARLNARYILQACQAGTCLDAAPTSVSGNLVAAIGFLKANAPASEDEFGYSVAVSDDGRTLVVGAPSDDSDHGGIALDKPAGAGEVANSGAVYVFAREGQAWRAQAFIKAELPLASAAFGETLALSANADTLAVGAPSVGGGSVHIFRRQGTAWSLWQRLDSPVTTSNSFGNALALSAPGQVLVIGDPREDSQGRDSGAAYVFSHDGTLWSQQAMLKAPATLPGDTFGTSVAITGAGDTIAVGSPNDRSVSWFGGAVYVFTGAGASWGPPLRLTAHQPVDDQGLGGSVALSRDGSTLASGALHDQSGATGIGGDAQNSGAPNSGAVHVFARQGAGWLHQAYLKASNTDPEDGFGRGLALSHNGDTLVAGAPYERSTADGLEGDQQNNGSSDVGAAYVFQRQGLDWRQQAYVKAPNSGDGDQFGWGLAISADGHTLAVGAQGESSAAGGWNPAQDNNRFRSGAVYLY